MKIGHRERTTVIFQKMEKIYFSALEKKNDFCRGGNVMFNKGPAAFYRV